MQSKILHEDFTFYEAILNAIALRMPDIKLNFARKFSFT